MKTKSKLKPQKIDCPLLGLAWLSEAQASVDISVSGHSQLLPVRYCQYKVETNRPVNLYSGPSPNYQNQLYNKKFHSF